MYMYVYITVTVTVTDDFLKYLYHGHGHGHGHRHLLFIYSVKCYPQYPDYYADLFRAPTACNENRPNSHTYMHTYIQQICMCM